MMPKAVLCIVLAFEAVHDIRRHEIHVLPAAAVGIFLAVYETAAEMRTPLSLLGGLMPGAFVFFLAFLLPDKIGAGDGIALMVCGCVFPLYSMMLLLFTALLAAGTGGLITGMVRKEKNPKIPFLPFLAAAAVFFAITG